MTVTHKWIAGGVAAALVLFAASWFLVIAPKRGEAADQRALADAQASTNAGLETTLSVLKQQKKQLPEEQAKLAALRTQVPQVAGVPSLINEFNTAADKAGVDVMSLTPSDAVVLGAGSTPTTPGAPVGGQLSAIDSDLVVSGSYFEIERFVNELENLDRYVLVSDMTVGVDETTQSSEGTTSQASQAHVGDLQATLTTRIYFLPEATDAASGTGTTATTPTGTAAPAA